MPVFAGVADHYLTTFFYPSRLGHVSCGGLAEGLNYRFCHHRQFQRGVCMGCGRCGDGTRSSSA